MSASHDGLGPTVLRANSGHRRYGPTQTFSERPAQEFRNVFLRSPLFIRMQGYRRRFAGEASRGGWQLVFAPGVALTVVALAMLIWPALLAYMVGCVLLFTGLTLVVWSWRLCQAERRLHQARQTIDRDNW
jgi:Flp pilus assembly protein TadB